MTDATTDWFWEGNVVVAISRSLEEEGWEIVSAANTHSKERGVDIHATKDRKILLVEVKRRWRNEPFEIIPQNVKAQFPIPELNGIIKIEGLMAVRVVGQYDRIVYPYFCETRALSLLSTRIALWTLGRALPRYNQHDIRVLDIFRSASFGIGDRPLVGNERRELLKNYSAVLDQWNDLKDKK